MPSGTTNLLVGDVYEAALEPDLWPSILERIADSVAATTTAFSMHDPITRFGTVLGHVRADPCLSRMYDDYYHQINPHAQRLMASLRVGELAIGQAAISDEALAATEYYNDFLKRQDLFHIAGGVIARDGSLAYAFTTLRPRRKGAFHVHELTPLQAILPHIARAARISKELNTSANILQSFVNLPIGLILLDGQCCALQLNASAQQILDQDDGLSLNAQGQLRLNKRNNMFEVNLSGAIGTSMGKGLHPGGNVLIERRSGKPPYRLSIMPLRVSNFIRDWKQAAAAVFVTDSDAAPDTDFELLQRHYGITKQEAVVAELLVRGLDVSEICTQLRVKKTTVRTQIRSLMTKFGVGRQVELVLKLTKFGARQIAK